MELKFTRDPAIPQFLIRDVLGKLAYLDERIRSAQVSGSGDQSRLTFGTAMTETMTSWRNGSIRWSTPCLRTHSSQNFAFSKSGGRRSRLARILYRSFTTPRGGAGGDRFFVIGPLLTQVIQYFEGRMIEVADAMGALPFRFPALISPRYLERVQYFKNFPHSLSFVNHLRKSPDIQSFMDQAAVVDDGSISAPAESYATPSAMLAPTVCHHLYLALSESELPENGIVATASGTVFVTNPSI